jgi:mycoredoxin
VSESSITVYWRPGCPFCYRLTAGLDDAGVAYDKVNIWDDDAAAAIVRSHARGNETVPTVVVRAADSEVGMVNPRVADVLAVAAGAPAR